MIKELENWFERMELRRKLRKVTKPTEVTVYPDTWQVKVDHSNNTGQVVNSEEEARALAELLISYGYPIKVRVSTNNEPASDWMDANDVWGL